MNPFDTPPSGSPMSVEPPEFGSDRPRRGKMALVAVLTAGLIGGGVVAVSQFASADRPDLAAQTTGEPSDDSLPPADDDPSDDSTDDAPRPSDPDVDGEIVLDDGDGDPIVIDLGDFDSEKGQRLTECLGLPLLDFDLGGVASGDFNLEGLDDFLEDLPFDLDQLEGGPGADFGIFGSDSGSVTVAGPDGVSVVDLGKNGSVTVTSNDGEITISSDGDATVSELDDLFGDFGAIFEGGPFEDGAFDEFLESMPNFDDLPDFEPIDQDAVQSCIDEVLGN